MDNDFGQFFKLYISLYYFKLLTISFLLEIFTVKTVNR